MVAVYSSALIFDLWYKITNCKDSPLYYTCLMVRRKKERGNLQTWMGVRSWNWSLALIRKKLDVDCIQETVFDQATEGDKAYSSPTTFHTSFFESSKTNTTAGYPWLQTKHWSRIREEFSEIESCQGLHCSLESTTTLPFLQRGILKLENCASVLNSLYRDLFHQGFHLLTHVEKPRPGQGTLSQSNEPSFISGIYQSPTDKRTRGQGCEVMGWVGDLLPQNHPEQGFPKVSKHPISASQDRYWSLYKRPSYECLKP